MKVEIMTNSEFKDLIGHLKVNAKCMYKCPEDIYNDHPYYEIWSLEKSDLAEVESTCIIEEVLFCYSNGEHRGTAYDLITINGISVIAWLEDSEKDTFNCLTDYFYDCLGVTDSAQINAYAVYLAKTNGWSLTDLWKKLEG